MEYSDAISVMNEHGEKVAVRYESEEGAIEWPVISLYDATHNSESEKLRQIRISNNRVNCFPVEFGRYRRSTLDNIASDFDSEAIAQAEMFVTRVCHNTDGGLVLYGEPGVGKTTLAAAICNALIDTGRKCRMTTLGALVDRRFEAKGNAKKAIEPYVSCDLTVIDDIGAEFSNEKRVELCEEILAALAGSGCRILFTTNLTLQQLSEPRLSARRIVGRIIEAGRLVRVTGPDRRQAVIA